MNSKKNYIMHLVFIVVFFIAGYYFASIINTKKLNKPVSKLINAIKMIDENSVVIPNWDEITPSTIKLILDKVDKHAVFKTKREYLGNLNELHSEYVGIGIYYDIIDNQLVIVMVIMGSPAYISGIRAGDKIVGINDDRITKINKKEIYHKLVGKEGSKLKLKIKRYNSKKEYEYTLVRSKVPLSTIATYFMYNKTTGYILLSRFAKSTTQEMHSAIADLQKKGMKKLILDLRNNFGGSFEVTLSVVNMFLKENLLIVSSENSHDTNVKKYFSQKSGNKYSTLPLILMVNKRTASSSEIFAGAIQDNDRGLIIGEKTYGSGLVQKEFLLKDTSSIRLSIGKYLTPSGRSIYKSILLDSLDSPKVFYTLNRSRKIIEKGGIIPDIEVNLEGNKKEKTNNDLETLLMKEQIYIQFANILAQNFKIKYKNIETFNKSFIIDEDIYSKFKQYLIIKKIKAKDSEFEKIKQIIAIQIKAEIAKIIFSTSAYYEIQKRNEVLLQKALIHFLEASTFVKKYKQ